MERMKFMVVVLLVVAGLWWYAHTDAGPRPGAEPSPYNHVPTTQEVRDYTRDVEEHPMSKTLAATRP
jgi:hypothetical protein